MDMLEYIEKAGAANGAARMDAYQEMHKRAHALATLLLGGAGAMGAYGLGLLEKQPSGTVAVPLLGASLWCFLVAALVVWSCLRARVTYPLANDPGVLQALMLEIRADADMTTDERVLRELRWREVGRVQGAIDSISQANAQVAGQLNRAYKAALFTPVIALLSPWAWPVIHGWLTRSSG